MPESQDPRGQATHQCAVVVALAPWHPVWSRSSSGSLSHASGSLSHASTGVYPSECEIEGSTD